jgi:hypothetical protein
MVTMGAVKNAFVTTIASVSIAAGYDAVYEGVWAKNHRPENLSDLAHCAAVVVETSR